MGLIPGWDSIASAGWWSGFYFWVSIVCLMGLGVAEVASHRYANRKDELVGIEESAAQKRHDDEIARLHIEASQAEERAAEALKSAAEALEQQEPMSLSLDQQKAIVASLQKFKGQKVSMVIFPPGDLSTALIVEQLHKILYGAEWDFQKPPADAVKQGAQFPGGIIVRETDNKQPSDAGQALIMALTKNGILAGGSTTVTDSEPPGIVIFVGPKPHPTNVKAMREALTKMMDPTNRPRRHPLLELAPEPPSTPNPQ